MREGGQSNFDFLHHHDRVFVQLAASAERAFVPDPSTTILKLRQLGEAFAKHAAAACGLYTGPEASQLDVLRALEGAHIVEGDTSRMFHALRRTGNRVAHEFEAKHKEAIEQLRLARQLAIWFHRTFGGSKAKSFKPGPFIVPEDPDAARLAAEQEVARLRAELVERDQKLRIKHELAEAETEARRAAEQARHLADAERAEWEALCATYEADVSQLLAEKEASLQAQQAEVAGATQPEALAEVASAASKATEAQDLSEEETRLLIDAQLRLAGWEADSKLLRHKAGTRPQKGKNLAIAEWPTDTGPADYVLFAGVVPVGVVEAKKQHKNVSGALEQAKRYAISYRFEPPQRLAAGARRYITRHDTHSLATDVDPSHLQGAFGWYAREDQGQPRAYRIPFLFATNGRDFIRQVKERSGIWFLDARSPTHHGEPIMGWPSPDGLLLRLEHDLAEAHDKLKEEPTDYTGLRNYQVRAVRAVEHAIEQGQRSILVAMATGTGKTRTVIGLIYRLLKTGRCRRVLFLVDRTALGEQAQNAFKAMRLEQNLPFDKHFDVKELGDLMPDASTRVHVATVQSMVRRVLVTKDAEDYLPVDAYDLVIVDESHRGYNLDREMTEGELELRGYADYVSMYRRVLDYFHAIKVGLTATPALHTKEIFGPPVYSYGYREAVVDGFLVDHEPPVRIVTKLAEHGIHFAQGEQVQLLLPGGVIELSELPDELAFEVADFNKRVVAPDFTRVVCEALAPELDPTEDAKTLVFCVTDEHADSVVAALKTALAKQWGEVEDNAVLKITGATDKCLEQIRRFKNEPQPNIAVTVDLLTTGIDVPKISNLVFLRRVRSRILYEQMLGRATRLCKEIGKERFRIFDAVDLYEALKEVTDMKPVVTNVNIGFDTLMQELTSDQAHEIPGSAEDRSHAHDVLDQVVARIRRAVMRVDKIAEVPEALALAVEALEQLTEGKLAELPDHLRQMSPAEARAYIESKPKLTERLMDVFAKLRGSGDGIPLSDDTDDLVKVEHGYGKGQKPEDYLAAFGQYIKEHRNEIAALNVVLTRPRDLTRAQLKELKLLLADHDYTEKALQTAWRQTTNQDIAASIIGFIRQQALGSPLMPYPDRVKRALSKVLGMHPWDSGQRAWLQRIANQLEQEVVVDQQAFESGFLRQKGGYKQFDKRLDGKLAQVLDAFGDALWDDVGAA